MDEQLALGLAQVRRTIDQAQLCTDEERDVAAALQWGRRFALQVPQIAELVGLPGRRVQEIIQHLLLEHQLPIGTAMAQPAGNYLIDNVAELNDTIELLRRRGISHLARAAALRRIPLRRFLAEVQTDLLQEEGRDP